MVIFVVKHIPEYETRQRVNKLVRNGKCMLDEFIEEVKKDNNIVQELADLTAILEDVANGSMVSPGKYKILKGSNKLKYNLCEAKSRHLRLYLFHEKDTGQILVFGGKKTTQTEDIERVKRIVKEYTAFKQTQ